VKASSGRLGRFSVSFGSAIVHRYKPGGM
jgi:hypothetical protein